MRHVTLFPSLPLPSCPPFVRAYFPLTSLVACSLHTHTSALFRAVPLLPIVISSPISKGVMYLANGLQAVAVGHSGEKVALADGTESALEYHANCDGGAAIPTADGGHIYVSNSEIGSYPDELTGGVYALTFDGQNQLTKYQQLLSDTAYNCHGGETPWGTWISCEEFRDNGRCWQGERNFLFSCRKCDGAVLLYLISLLFWHIVALFVVLMMNSGSHWTEGAGAHRRDWPIHGWVRKLCRLLLVIFRRTVSLTSPSFVRSFFLLLLPTSILECRRALWRLGGLRMGC